MDHVLNGIDTEARSFTSIEQMDDELDPQLSDDLAALPLTVLDATANKVAKLSKEINQIRQAMESIDDKIENAVRKGLKAARTAPIITPTNVVTPAKRQRRDSDQSRCASTSNDKRIEDGRIQELIDHLIKP
ncbi:hypothetical protein E0Z10_g9034 [Xylaria hypoxylon]|uniref:Uncharacterized protein n=1 Tax=Xylaria hypoxylon TaxID=37992 RepID=A0A4Z0Y7E8_9PEZI|nr:hypothetical protein E0Z10_g9034 [Xylaria hypoxylon]